MISPSPYLDDKFLKLRLISGLLSLLITCPSPAAGAQSRPAESASKLEARLLYAVAARSMATGSYDSALERLRRLIRHYGESKYVADARQKLASIRCLQNPLRPINSCAQMGLVSFGTLYATGLGVGTGVLAESSELVYAMVVIAGPCSRHQFELANDPWGAAQRRTGISAGIRQIAGCMGRDSVRPSC